MAIGSTDDRADDAEAEIDVDSDPLNNMTERCKAGGTDACKDGNACVANRAMHRDDPLLKHTPFQVECRPVPKRTARLNSNDRVVRYRISVFAGLTFIKNAASKTAAAAKDGRCASSWAEDDPPSILPTSGNKTGSSAVRCEQSEQHGELEGYAKITSLGL